MAASTGTTAWAGFTITDLGPVAAGQAGGATGVNAAGAASGTVSGSGTTGAVQSSPGGGFVGINTQGLPGATSSSGAAINSSGDVAGTFYDSLDKQNHAFRSSGGQAVDLGTFAGGKLQGASSWGVAINAGDEVLGTAQLKDGSKVVFRSTGPGGANPIILPGGSMTGQAAGLNDSGTAVGSYTTALGLSRVFIDTEGQPATDLLAKFSVRGFGLNSYAAAINNQGDVTGYGDFNGQSHAFFASSRGTFVDIGVTGGFSSSISIGLNGQGQVVGQLSNGGSSSRAFLWDQSVGLFDLNSLLAPADSRNWVLTSATGINDSDQIVGQGYVNGQLHGYLLTTVAGTTPFMPLASVPTPPSAWLATAGLALAGGWRRLRRGRTAAPGNA